MKIMMMMILMTTTMMMITPSRCIEPLTFDDNDHEDNDDDDIDDNHDDDGDHAGASSLQHLAGQGPRPTRRAHCSR